MPQSCELFSLIPRDKLDYLFRHSNASAELDYTFLGFEEIYRDVLSYVPRDMVILDLGCGYAAQSYFFRDHAKYIGVDSSANADSVIHTENSEFYFTSIQDFISNILPMLDIDLKKIFAVCSYVPDFAATDLVLQTFPFCRAFYPARFDVVRPPEVREQKPTLDRQISGAASRAAHPRNGREPQSPER